MPTNFIPMESNMEYVKSECIVTHQILEESGEITTKDFKEIKTGKQIKGGFRMTYASYDIAVMNIIKSKKDFEIVLFIRNLFTYNNSEKYISSTDIAKTFEVSKQKVTQLITASVEEKLLLRVNKGTYRLNPFMFVPFRADAALLQKEWKDLINKPVQS